MEMSAAFDQSFTYLIDGDEIVKIRGHLEFVAKPIRAEARTYLVDLLASGASDEQLHGIWPASSSQLIIYNGIRWWFEAIRDNL
jgi:hypothetical protein